MKWIKPNTITGSLAEGSKYFRRKDIEDGMWNEITKQNNVLFLAPRRVGKSSIVLYMSNNPKAGFACKYEDIESDNSIQDFYKRLCRMTYEALSVYGKNKKWLSNWWKTWSIKSVGTDKLEIGKVDIDYREDFFNLLAELKTQNEKVVLFLDEFPDVVWNVYKHQGDKEAQTLITDIRTLHHTDEFKQVFTMVLLGSVGLSHIVKKIFGRIDKINQLHKEYLPPLQEQQAREFLNFLIRDVSMQLDDSTKSHLLSKIGHFIPYYIQLVIEECDEILFKERRQELTTTDIDIAYERLLKKHNFFEDWDSRLSKYFSSKYAYLLEVLSNCANQSNLTLQEIYDIAAKHNNEQEWKADLDDILVADGYISEDEGQFYFNSPLLRDWWKSRHPIMKKS